MAIAIAVAVTVCVVVGVKVGVGVGLAIKELNSPHRLITSSRSTPDIPANNHTGKRSKMLG
jgi:hypothetical protein